MSLLEEVAAFDKERIDLALSLITEHRTCDPKQVLREVEAALRGACMDVIEDMREEGDCGRK